MMIRTSRPIRSSRIGTLPVLLIFVLLCPLHVRSFATYMLTGTGCMTDLSTDEVIMNANVVAASSSDRQDVRLELVSQDAVTKQEPMEDGRSRIFLKDLQQPLQLQLRLDAPKVHDMQFVVETSPGATLEHGQCDDAKRVAARGRDTVTLLLSSGGSGSPPISVWAGWATGHEAVRLTPLLEFHWEKPEEGQDNEEQHLGGHLQHHQKVEKKGGDDENDHRKHRGHHSKESKLDRKKMDRPHAGPPRQPRGHARNKVTISESVDEVMGQVSSRSLSKRARNSRPKKLLEQQRKRSLTQKIKEHLTKHKKEDGQKEPGIQLDTTRFVYGLGILLLGTFLVVQCCLHATGKGGDSIKGRRTI